MSVGLDRYILTVLKMPSQGIKTELVTRLNNLSSLSGTPMSPLLTKWVQQNLGLNTVNAIVNWSAGKFTPSMLIRWKLFIPNSFEGTVIRQDLYDTLTGAGAVPITYLLDSYPGARAAYSVRRLSSSYSGSALRVRRSSDNTEQDIGFVGLNLDTTALTSFVGAGNGFVTIWYDQSGNGKNKIQATSTQQPTIVNSGSIELVNGKPSIYFDGTNDYIETNASINIGTTISSFIVGRLSRNHTSYSRLINGKSDQIYYIGTDTSENIVSGYGNNFAWSAITANSVTTWLNTQRIVISLNNGTDSQFVNGVAKTPRVAAMAAFNNNIIIGGMYYNGINVPTYDQAWQGTIQEYIVYNTYESANRIAIETNINGYYNIYP